MSDKIEKPDPVDSLEAIAEGRPVQVVDTALYDYSRYVKAENYDHVSSLFLDAARRIHGLVTFQVSPDRATVIAQPRDHGRISHIDVSATSEEEFDIPTMLYAVLLAKHIMEKRDGDLYKDGLRYRITGVTHETVAKKCKEVE